MDIILIPLLGVTRTVLGIYAWIVIASIIMHWLINFNVVNSHNNFVLMLMEFLYKATEPVLSKIRHVVPGIGGFDLSPVVLIIILWFLQAVLRQLMLRMLVGCSV